jgi:Flp pilus assembly protein TadG
MHVTARPGLLDAARRLRHDDGGLALLEFALSLPLVLAMGAYGIELSNLALANMRISQYALDLADNASRVGQSSNLASVQLRESDLNDVLTATALEGQALNLTTRGRITLSSLENVQQSYDTAPIQRIHWQRCIGALGTTANDGYDSSYGTAPVAAGTTATQANAGTAQASGMGDAGSQVIAPSGSGLMFVEINYNYRPLFGSLFVSTTKIHYIASFIVRDKRDFSQIYNPSPGQTRSTCDLHNANPPAYKLS